MNYRNLFIFVFSISITSLSAFSQDTIQPFEIIKELCSDKMYGRGYVKKGDEKAAVFIKKQLQTYGANPLVPNYFQDFAFSMNTFPGQMEIKLDGKLLNPVYDYVVAPESRGLRGKFELSYLPNSADTLDAIWDSIIKIDYSGKVVVANLPKRKIQQQNPFNASAVAIPKQNIYWWASTGNQLADVPIIVISDSLMQAEPKSIAINFENTFIAQYKSQNVLAWVEGAVEPDSFIVFTAHYDHLGCMGRENVFKGANDNASGTAMVLALAEYYSRPENKPNYSIAFLFFAAEESGLIGSSYFVNNPIFPLAQIKSLINIDMVGSGSEGIALVNGEENQQITTSIEAINNAKSYFSSIQIRGASCNSDHCFFARAGVPAVFIYTKGSECKAYHNLDDVPEAVPLTKFTALKELLIEFTEF